MMPAWLGYALTTCVLWGIWGAFLNVPTQHGFPETLSYVVWALTMLVPAVVVLIPARFRIDRDWKSILYGLIIGVTGCGGQVALFKVATMGPTFLIFPILALAPLVTIVMSMAFLGERTGKAGTVGVV